MQYTVLLALLPDRVRKLVLYAQKDFTKIKIVKEAAYDVLKELILAKKVCAIYFQ